MSAGPGRSPTAVVACLVLAAALTGCGAPVAPTLPEGVDAALVQQRSDVASRQAQVRIRNDSDTAVTVGAVSVADPRFLEPARRVVDRTSVLAPGASVDVRVQLGAVDCAAPDAAESTLSLQYTTAAGTHVGVAPLPELVPFLAALHAAECVREHATERAAFAWGAFTPSPAGAPATLELVVTGRGGDAVEVTGVRETNLLAFPGDELVQDLGVTSRAGETLRIPLPLVPARCDPHAVQEDKRGTVFRIEVELDGEPGSFDLPADPDLRAELLTWVAQWCGYAPGS